MARGVQEDIEQLETVVREGVGLDIYNLAVTGDTAASLTTATGQGASNTGPSVMEVVAYNGENITSPLNKTNPQPGDPCHTLGTDSRNYVVIAESAGFCTEHSCVIAIDRAFFNQGQNAQYDPQLYEDGTNPTLVARGPNAVVVRYIVRRLTPTECARLQGFADRWGDIDPKEAFADEEYRFWLDVRNTHATVIGGKEAKDYTKQQILTWYNKLHTDSAEYKMWGNGIALPPALYCMQGMVDALNAEADSTPDSVADEQPAEEKKKKIALVKRKH